MLLCNSEVKNQVESNIEYTDLEKELDSMKLLAMIKKLPFCI